MEFSAEELRFCILKLHQKGINIPEYEKLISKLQELAQKLGDTKGDIDFWCENERLAELEFCRDKIESMNE
ncbi:MAG: hypothetical protein JSV25_04370 [Spirochaetota bacterium]|nr:MAG: hypothetical protein JSV25_04370 [Spirochaetota bacterium]